MDIHVIYATSSMPLQPSECDLLRTLLNQRIALGRRVSPAFSEQGRSTPQHATSNTGHVLGVMSALEHSGSGDLFGKGWQVTGSCRAFKIEVKGLAVCRLICRWIKSGKFDGLPRKGVKMRFQLIGDPVQQPSKMRAELETTTIANSPGAASAGPVVASLPVDRHRYNMWDKTRRGVCANTDDEGAEGKEALEAGGTGLGTFIPNGDSGLSIFGWNQGGGEAREANIVRTRNMETAVLDLLKIRERQAAAVREGESEMFGKQRPGQRGWGDDATDIKKRLQHLDAKMRSIVGG